MSDTVDCPVPLEYFDRLDGLHPDGVLALFAPVFRVLTLWGVHRQRHHSEDAGESGPAH